MGNPFNKHSFTLVIGGGARGGSLHLRRCLSYNVSIGTGRGGIVKPAPNIYDNVE